MRSRCVVPGQVCLFPSRLNGPGMRILLLMHLDLAAIVAEGCQRLAGHRMRPQDDRRLMHVVMSRFPVGSFRDCMSSCMFRRQPILAAGLRPWRGIRLSQL